MSCNIARQLDLMGYGDTWFHRLDSRVKLLATAVFILCIISSAKYEISGLMPFFIIIAIWASLGQVPYRLLFRVIIIAAPFAIIVGAFNPLLDRSVVLVFESYYITGGWLSFLSIILKVLLTISMVVMFIATTSFAGVCQALLELRVPRLFVLQLQFLYRYLFVLLEEGQQVSNARILRQPKKRLPSYQIAARMLSSIICRSFDRSQRVSLCMKARGFIGEFPTVKISTLSRKDIFFIIVFCFYCILVRIFPITVLFGLWLKGFH